VCSSGGVGNAIAAVGEAAQEKEGGREIFEGIIGQWTRGEGGESRTTARGVLMRLSPSLKKA